MRLEELGAALDGHYSRWVSGRDGKTTLSEKGQEQIEIEGVLPFRSVIVTVKKAFEKSFTVSEEGVHIHGLVSSSFEITSINPHHDEVAKVVDAFAERISPTEQKKLTHNAA